MKDVGNLDRTFENKPIFDFLVKNSGLTRRQVLALLMYRKDLHLKSSERKTRLLGEKVIKKGAYYRILGQARKNAIKSFFTMILLHHLDIIDDASWNMIAELSAVLKTYEENEEIREKNVEKMMENVISAFGKMLSIKETG